MTDRERKQLENQLSALSLSWEEGGIELIRSKDGVHLCRVRSQGGSLVLKYLEKPEYRREIQLYRLLDSLAVPTIPIVAATQEAILLEDLEQSPVLRLAVAEDMADAKVAAALAVWYGKLHRAGKRYLQENPSAAGGFYRETDCLTAENLARIREKTRTEGHPVWKLAETFLPRLLQMLEQTEETLVYNDFYYTNMAVSRDRSSALLFDYNFLGAGLACADLQNVTSALSPAAGKVFLQAYGQICGMPSERDWLLARVSGALASVYTASCRESFPPWGHGLLAYLLDGDFSRHVELLLG